MSFAQDELFRRFAGDAGAGFFFRAVTVFTSINNILHFPWYYVTLPMTSVGFGYDIIHKNQKKKGKNHPKQLTRVCRLLIVQTFAKVIRHTFVVFYSERHFQTLIVNRYLHYRTSTIIFFSVLRYYTFSCSFCDVILTFKIYIYIGT